MVVFIRRCKILSCMARKPYITVTLPPELIEYLEQKVKDREFANVSHGVELCILRYKQAEERGERP